MASRQSALLDRKDQILILERIPGILIAFICSLVLKSVTYLLRIGMKGIQGVGLRLTMPSGQIVVINTFPTQKSANLPLLFTNFGILDEDTAFIFRRVFMGVSLTLAKGGCRIGFSSLLILSCFKE